MDLKKLESMGPWSWPPEAAGLLLSTLASGKGDHPDRLLAAELASSVTVMNDDLARALVAIVRDAAESARIRAAAAISLGPTLEELVLEDLDDPDPEGPLVSEEVARGIREGLRAVYADADAPKDVRRMALEASVRAEEDWHPDAVRAAYHSGDDEWRTTAVFCMRYVPGFESEIVEALESADPEIRYQAVEAAGVWGVEAAWPHVRAIVRAEGVDKPLLLAAIDAVESIRPEEASEVLGHLIDSRDEDIADAVFDALEEVEMFWDDEDEPD